MLNIERSSLKDLEKIVNLNYRIFDGMYEDKPYSLEQYKNKLRDKEPIIFISKLDGEIVGDSISFERDNSFYIWIFGVDKKYRTRGIGNLLLNKNEQFARENKYKSVSVKVYNVSEEMQLLLKNRGYKIVETNKSNISLKYTSVHFELEAKDIGNTNS